MKLPARQREALDLLHTASKTNTLVDEEISVHRNTLSSLREKRMAHHVGEGLWRITLGGVAYIKAGRAPQARRKIPTAERVLVALEGQALTAREIAEQIDKSVRAVTASLCDLYRRGDVKRTGLGGVEDPYRYEVT